MIRSDRGKSIYLNDLARLIVIPIQRSVFHYEKIKAVLNSSVMYWLFLLPLQQVLCIFHTIIVGLFFVKKDQIFTPQNYATFI